MQILAGEEAELELWEVQVGKRIAPEMMKHKLLYVWVSMQGKRGAKCFLCIIVYLPRCPVSSWGYLISHLQSWGSLNLQILLRVAQLKIAAPGSKPDVNNSQPLVPTTPGM